MIATWNKFPSLCFTYFLMKWSANYLKKYFQVTLCNIFLVYTRFRFSKLLKLTDWLFKQYLDTYGNDPMNKGKVSSKCVSGGAEWPLLVGWWSSCRLPWRPVRVMRALCHRPFVIGTGDLSQWKLNRYYYLLSQVIYRYFRIF